MMVLCRWLWFGFCRFCERRCIPVNLARSFSDTPDVMDAIRETMGDEGGMFRRYKGGIQLHLDGVEVNSTLLAHDQRDLGHGHACPEGNLRCNEEKPWIPLALALHARGSFADEKVAKRANPAMLA